ncbi:hypothetical protein QYF36_004285 [Acer negundo]|nr:hypothetical protein QYF36_004285 [Acer negundo]
MVKQALKGWFLLDQFKFTSVTIPNIFRIWMRVHATNFGGGDVARSGTDNAIGAAKQPGPTLLGATQQANHRFLFDVGASTMCFAPDHYQFLATKLVKAYSHLGHLSYARHVLDHFPHPKTVLCNAMVNGYVQNERHKETLDLFRLMDSFELDVDSYTCNFALKACSGLGDYEAGREIIRIAFDRRINDDRFLGSSMISFLVKFDDIDEARRVFDGLLEKDVVCWNSMIGGYTKACQYDKAFGLFQSMCKCRIRPSPVTLVSLIQACVGMKNIEFGKCVHGCVLGLGMSEDVLVVTSLVDMYSKMGDIESARTVFEGMSMKNLVSWNAIISGCVQNGSVHESFELFRRLVLSGGVFDSGTIVSLLQGCAQIADLESGKILHCCIFRRGLELNLILCTAIVDLYSKCGALKHAKFVFERTKNKNVITWTAMLVGLAQNGYAEDALKLFSQMQEEGVSANLVTLVSLLHSCAHLGSLKKGRSVHGQFIRKRFAFDAVNMTALIDIIHSTLVSKNENPTLLLHSSFTSSLSLSFSVTFSQKFPGLEESLLTPQILLGMYKNQLQELAQRSCFNLPSYSCIREGPDHAPRFKATVNFNGDTFESPTFCSTLRQAEHAAAEVALNTLANRGPSRALAARVLDETGVYKNLLQETAHKAGLNLPVYTTVRTGPGHVPVFSCTVELAGMSFTGEPSRTKKQAQKNSAMTAWSVLKRMSQQASTASTSSSSSPSVESKCNEEQEQVVIARFLASLQSSESKHFMQNDSGHGHQRSISICRDLTPTPTLYPMQCQNWTFPSFPPEMTLYQMWQQEQLLQLQNHHLTLPALPTPPLGPQILPYMQSIFRPDHHLYVPARKQEPLPVRPRLTVADSSPSLYFSSNSVPDPTSGTSTVTIQEIHEGKTEESSKFSPSGVSKPPVPIHTNPEPEVEEPRQEDSKQKNVEMASRTNVEQESKIENVKLEGNQPRQSDSGFRIDNLQSQNPCVFDSSKSYLRPQYSPRANSHKSFRPPSSASAAATIRAAGSVSSARPLPQNLASRMPAPPRVRTAVPSCSFRPSTDRMNFGMVQPSFLAPAVRIRTVVPVCSAPPPKQIPGSAQARMSPNREKKDNEQEDVSTATSELDKLHI